MSELFRNHPIAPLGKQDPSFFLIRIMEGKRGGGRPWEQHFENLTRSHEISRTPPPPEKNTPKTWCGGHPPQKKNPKVGFLTKPQENFRANWAHEIPRTFTGTIFMQNDAERGTKVSIFTENLVPCVMRNASHLAFLGQLCCLGWVVIQNLRRFGFLGQVDCSGWLFSGLQSKLRLSLRNLMLRQQLAEHDALLWMKIELLSLLKLLTDEQYEVLSATFGTTPQHSLKCNFLTRSGFEPQNLMADQGNLKPQRKRLCFVSVYLSVSVCVCVCGIACAHFGWCLCCNFPLSLLWLSVVWFLLRFVLFEETEVVTFTQTLGVPKRVFWSSPTLKNPTRKGHGHQTIR